jgi:hypothetical protein
VRHPITDFTSLSGIAQPSSMRQGAPSRSGMDLGTIDRSVPMHVREAIIACRGTLVDVDVYEKRR